MKSAALCALVIAAGCQTKSEPRDQPTPATTQPQSSSATASSPPPSGAAPAQRRRPSPPPLPDPLPGRRTDLTKVVDKAWRAAIADLDGDGRRELVVVDSKALRVLDATGREVTSAPAGGGIHSLVAADLDGDRRAELYAGWGQTRDHMNASARITAHRFEGGKLVEELVIAPDTSRHEVVALVPMPDSESLLIGYFDSKYMVTTSVMRKSGRGWTAEKVASLRTATSYARGDVDGDGKSDLVVGRVYGDDQGSDGDAFVLAPDGSRTTIPSTRGLRSLAVFDSNDDGCAEIFMGDGWHQNYGQNARALLTWVKHGKDGFHAELIEDTVGQFELMRIVPANLDGKPAVVTVGSHYVRVFVRDGDRWRGHTIAGAARDVAVGDLDGRPGDEIVVVGDKSELVDLRGALAK